MEVPRENIRVRRSAQDGPYDCMQKALPLPKNSIKQIIKTFYKMNYNVGLAKKVKEQGRDEIKQVRGNAEGTGVPVSSNRATLQHQNANMFTATTLTVLSSTMPVCPTPICLHTS